MKRFLLYAAAFLLSANATAQENTDTITTTTPNGRLTYDYAYSSMASGTDPTTGSNIFGATRKNQVKAVVTNGKDFYYQQPFTMLPDIKSWVHGTINGDTLVIHTPQPVAKDKKGNLCYIGSVTYGGYYGYTPVIDKKNADLKFVMRNDSIILVSGNKSIGLFDSQGNDLEYSEDGVVFVNLAPRKTTVPETKAWKYTVTDAGKNISTVDVVWADDAVYVGNMLTGVKDGWIKGNIEGDKITFDKEQYIGIDSVNNTHVFFVPATKKEEYETDWYGNVIDTTIVTVRAEDITFNYDADAKSMTTEGIAGFGNPTRPNTWDNIILSWDKPTFTEQVLPGKVTNFTGNVIEEGGRKAIKLTFTAPTESANGTTIESITKIDVYRGARKIKTFDNPVPGETLTFTDDNPKAGDNSYTAIVSNASGESEAVTIIVSTETTGINTIGTATKEEPAEIFTIDGKRIANINISDLKKGLYVVITNGTAHKILVK